MGPVFNYVERGFLIKFCEKFSNLTEVLTKIFVSRDPSDALMFHPDPSLGAVPEILLFVSRFNFRDTKSSEALVNIHV